MKLTILVRHIYTVLLVSVISGILTILYLFLSYISRLKCTQSEWSWDVIPLIKTRRFTRPSVELKKCVSVVCVIAAELI